MEITVGYQFVQITQFFKRCMLKRHPMLICMEIRASYRSLETKKTHCHVKINIAFFNSYSNSARQYHVKMDRGSSDHSVTTILTLLF